MSTPIKLMELTLKNFMSYGNNVTIINLDFKDPVMIVGKNHDAAVNGQVDSNGAGKSAILDAITFALYDKTISNKDKTRLINNINNKDLEVSLTFNRNGVQYKIVRSRKTKTKADIQLLTLGDNGEYIDKTPDSIANANAEIEKIIGLPFDIFARIIVFSATFQPFLDLPSRHASQASQTSIMDELFGNTELNEKAEALKEKITQVKAEFIHIQKLQAQVANEISRQQGQLHDVKERIDNWQISHEKKVRDINENIAELSKIDIDVERKLLSDIDKLVTKQSQLLSDKKLLESEIKTLENQIKSVNDKKAQFAAIQDQINEIEKSIDFDKEEQVINELDAIEEKIKKSKDTFSTLSRELKTFNSKFNELQKEIDHLKNDECPYCGQEFADSAKRLESLSLEHSELANTIQTMGDEVASNENDIAEYNKKHEKLKAKSKFGGSRQQLSKARSQYDIHRAQLESYSDDNISNDTYGRIETAKIELDGINESIDKITSALSARRSKCTFKSIAEVEQASAKLDSLKDKLQETIIEDNPHIETYTKMEELLVQLQAQDDKTEKLNELDTTLKHQEFLLKLLTKKDSFLRKNLLDRSLPFLNKRLMGYLEKLGLPHRVEFQPDMSAHISQFGTELDFSSLSSGQKARVNLALAFAFRDVLQARHGKISFCMLDECLDHGLGNVGVQLAAKMIKQIATEENMSMFVISHRDEVTNMFPRQMVVELKNGFSTITSQ